jgi:hypothetical protein
VAFMQTGQLNNITLILNAGQTSGGIVQVTIVTANQDVVGSAPFNSLFYLTNYRPTLLSIPSVVQLAGSGVSQSVNAFYVNASSSITVVAYTERVSHLLHAVQREL